MDIILLEKETYGMQYDNNYYITRVAFIKHEMSRIFGETIVLENEKNNFKQRGYFQLNYKYSKNNCNYTISIENEIRLFNIFISDREEAKISLFRIHNHNNNLDDLKNITHSLNLLFNVLEENNFTLYFSKDGKYYKKTPQGVFRVKNMIEELYGK